jgi:hypothetical protein
MMSLRPELVEVKGPQDAPFIGGEKVYTLTGAREVVA